MKTHKLTGLVSSASLRAFADKLEAGYDRDLDPYFYWLRHARQYRRLADKLEVMEKKRARYERYIDEHVR